MTAGGPIPASVDQVLQVWLRHHDRLAPGLIEGLYVVGSAVLDDWQPDSDIDIVACTAAVAGQDEVAAIESANRAARSELDGAPVDGPRLTWADLTAPPAPAIRPWTLDGEFHHDDGCFELNPVTWYTLATYGAAVRGPDRADLGVHTDGDALIRFARSNTESYWAAVATGVAEAAEDPGRRTFKPEMTAWCVLGLARMLYTTRTGDVTSKSAAGWWLADQLPRYRELVEHALAIRQGGGPSTDSRETARATAAYLEDVVGLVTEG